MEEDDANPTCSAHKPLTTTLILNGVFGIVTRGRGSMRQKRAFVEGLVKVSSAGKVRFRGTSANSLLLGTSSLIDYCLVLERALTPNFLSPW